MITTHLALFSFFDGMGGTPTSSETYSGGWLPHQRYQTPEEIRERREELGILPRRVIHDVAARQVENPILDEQQRFEELLRELELNSIQYEARYLTALNAERERLLDAEIYRLFEQRREDDAVALILIAAVV